jgi:hypothetical protein
MHIPSYPEEFAVLDVIRGLKAAAEVARLPEKITADLIRSGFLPGTIMAKNGDLRTFTSTVRAIRAAVAKLEAAP